MGVCKRVTKINVNLIAKLIGAQGAKTPAGGACPGETPQERSDEEASGPPAQSEAPGAEINGLKDAYKLGVFFLFFAIKSAYFEKTMIYVIIH